MYERIFDVADFAIFAFQGWCLKRFYARFMENRLKVPCGKYIIIAVWVACKLLLNRFVQVDYNHVRAIGKIGLALFILLVATIGLYQAKTALKIYLSVTFMAVTEISFFFSYLVMLLGTNLFSFWTWCLEKGYIASFQKFERFLNMTVLGLQMVMYVIMGWLIFFLLDMLARRYREKDYVIQKSELMFILTPSMVGLLLCVLLRMIVVTVENEVPILLYDKYPLLLVLTPIILILSLLSIVYGIQLLQDMINLNREKSGRLILEQQVSSMQEHFQEMDRLYSGIRSMKHDMKNQLAVITQLLKQKDESALQAHLLEMNQTMERLDYRFLTGNAVADTILNMKYYEAMDRVPDIQIEADGFVLPKKLRIRSYDLAVVLCNALDNAIEACENKESTLFERLDREKQYIRIRSYLRGKMLFLEIENSFDGRIACPNGSEFPESRKKDGKMHGIGLYNIKTAVWKYGGAVDWEVRGNIFLLTMMMKNEEIREVRI